jgi:hypothetical protein
MNPDPDTDPDPGPIRIQGSDDKKLKNTAENCKKSFLGLGKAFSTQENVQHVKE